MKKQLLLLMMLLLSLRVFAQLEVKPGSFKEVVGFVNLDLNKQTDDNDQPYAVLKIKTENINDKQRRELNFQGDARTFFELEYRDGEVWLYISYYATYLKISHPDLSSTEFYFPFDMQGKKGYELILVNNAKSDIDEQKIKSMIDERLENASVTSTRDTIVVQTVLVDESYSFLTVNASYNNYGKLAYGLTIGSMKKMGWFVSVMSNFNFKALSTDYECGDDFLVDGYYPFYTGKEVYSSISATGGVMFKLVDELALKIGVGYGLRNAAYEMTDGKYVKNTDVSTAGLEVSVGAHYKIRKFIVSLDCVTTNFKYFEAKLGIGMGY